MTEPKAVDQFRTAGESHDLELAMAACADDIVVHSPLTDRHTFRGRAEVEQLFRIVYERFSGIRYHQVIGEGRHWALFGDGTVDGQRTEEALRLTLDDDGRIADITFYIRPLPGLAAVMAALGPPLARGNGRSRVVAGLLRVMVAPLVFATRVGDRIGIRLAFGRRQPA
jgi:hypothetical protein